MTPALWIAAALGVLAVLALVIRGLVRADCWDSGEADSDETAHLLALAAAAARYRAMANLPAQRSMTDDERDAYRDFRRRQSEPSEELALDRLRRAALGGRDRGLPCS